MTTMQAHACMAHDSMVESRIDVFQDVKAMLEYKVDIKVLAIIGPGQGTEAKIVKRILSWSQSGFTWNANPKHAAAPTPGSPATTKTLRKALE